MRTWKKIEETRKRASEVFQLKKKNEEKINMKIESIKQTQQHIRENQQKVHSMRKQREQEKRKISEAILLNKREEARLGKAQTMHYEHKKNEFMARAEEENKRKSGFVKEQLRIASIKRQEFERRKIEVARRDFDKRVDGEERQRAQKEQEVMQMEMLEMELIKKLQNTQAVQKQAYQNLEEALAQPSYYMAPEAKKALMSGGNIDPNSLKAAKVVDREREGGAKSMAKEPTP